MGKFDKPHWPACQQKSFNNGNIGRPLRCWEDGITHRISWPENAIVLAMFPCVQHVHHCS